MSLEKISAAQLQSRYDSAFEKSGALCRELIAAGFGNERANETRQRAAETGDPLACRYVKEADKFAAIVAEMDARKRYHGSLRPIRRRAA